MVFRQCKEKEFQGFEKALMLRGRQRPFCPIYEVDIVFNGERYLLFLQPDRHNRVYALYALHVVLDREANAHADRLITKNTFLMALLELLLFQAGDS